MFANYIWNSFFPSSCFMKTLHPDLDFLTQEAEFCYFGPYTDCNCKHLQYTEPSPHHLGKLSIKIQREKHLITYSLPCVLFLNWWLNLYHFHPSSETTGSCRPVIYVVLVLCGLRFQSFWNQGFVLWVCSVERGWVGAWITSMRVGDNEGVSLHTSQIRSASSLPSHYLFKER